MPALFIAVAFPMTTITVALAQVNPLVGDIPGNTRITVEALDAARAAGARLVLLPELMLTGYPPEDLLLRSSLDRRIEAALAEVAAASEGITAVVGYPRRRDGQLFNMAGVFSDGRLVAEYAKQLLPNYQVFDEKRYFGQGTAPCVIDIDGTPMAIAICEDIWQPGPMAAARDAGARVLLAINASPFHRGKQDEREAVVAQRAREAAMPVVYLNQVGGQDELVFDGGSMAVDADGEVCWRAPLFEQGLHYCQLHLAAEAVTIVPGELAPVPDLLPSVYQALVVGVRDYINKNRFKGVVLGLSGGIDSALTLAVAVDALGPERVKAVMMPFRYTSQLSRDDAAEQAKRMGVSYQSLSIEPMYEAFMATLAEEFEGLPVDLAEQNIQARVRGILLMAISNKKGLLVLTTSNKSEVAVGYSTLYGDMAGGFDVLKDVPKTLVFELSRYRNTLSPVIPESVISRPPSAELAPDQKDEDSLPPYPVLDRILELYIEEDWSAEAIVGEGFERDDVYKVVRLVDLNEYKRRQAPIGVRITRRGFGRDRRYPVTNGWRAGE